MKILKIGTEKRRLGDLGERAAARYLRRHGYRIIERNYVADGHEIDIIARAKDTLVFVEVKTRIVGAASPMEERPASAVTPEKQRKILRTASYYKAYNPDSGRMRFDIIEVMTEDTVKGPRVSEIKHLIGAFNKDTAYLPPWRRR